MSEELEFLSIPGHVPVKEAARLLDLSEDRVYQLINKKRLVAKKVEGRHMVQQLSIEAFKHKPPGRVREKAPKWRVYDDRITLLNMEIRVRVRAGQQGRFEEMVRELLDRQGYRFAGTMARYILRQNDDQDMVTISLFWKDNEMPDEETRQHNIAAFRDAFADVLDWEHAEIIRNKGLLYT